MRSEALVLLVLLSACTWETDLPEGATSIPVDTKRELLVTDVASLGSNADDAPFSFRHATEHLALGEGATARWLDAWSRRLEAEGHAERARVLDERVTQPWLRADPPLSLAKAPFRLVAVVNRTDLSVMPDRAADGGEGRLVFAVTDGPADDPNAKALPLAVIYEYAQHGTALEWTRNWHERGVDVARGFVDDGTLAQLRTADALTGPMVLHQFVLTNGDLVASDVRNSPDWSKTSPDEVRAFAETNAAAIDDGTAVLPRKWWARSSAISDAPPAAYDGVPKRDAIQKQTCGGCHAQAESGFQIDPVTGAPSTFEQGEMRRRTEWMQLELFSAQH